MKVIFLASLLAPMSAFASGYTFFSGLAHSWHIPEHTIGLTFVGGLILLAGFIYRARVRSLSNTDVLIPAGDMSVRSFVEFFGEAIFKLVESIVGVKKAGRYFPLAFAVFVLVLISNLLGLVPGFLPPTNNLNTTLALGLLVFLYYNIEGIRAVGVKNHFAHLLGPVWWLAPLMLVIEIVSHFVRPISLALRLRSNMEGDHMVVATFTDMTYVIVPVIFMFLGTMVCVIQAFVFTILSLVYVNLAISSHDHDDH
jgi:F-type H+-transporting ATPase subunit a